MVDKYRITTKQGNRGYFRLNNGNSPLRHIVRFIDGKLYEVIDCLPYGDGIDIELCDDDDQQNWKPDITFVFNARDSKLFSIAKIE